MTSARPKIDFDAKIPNNVDLASDRKLQRALERWQTNFLDWWGDMGPAVDTKDVYLRTAVDVGRDGWAHFDHVPMNEYRWGVFLSEHDPDRRIAFGEHKGEPVWQEVPGEYRADLQRLIVIQGDTEPASIEQQRRLGHNAPSLYEIESLDQQSHCLVDTPRRQGDKDLVPWHQPNLDRLGREDLPQRLYDQISVHSIISSSRANPSIIASGRQGQPGTYISTGITRSTPPRTLAPPSNMPPEQLQLPMAITHLGAGICS